jgi:hypothetical protein
LVQGSADAESGGEMNKANIALLRCCIICVIQS